MSSNTSGSLVYQQLQEVLQKRTWESPLLASRHCGPAHHFSNLSHSLPHQLYKSRSLIVRGFLVCLKSIIVESRFIPFPHLSPLAENSYMSHACPPCPIIKDTVMLPPVYSSSIIHFLKFYIIMPICKTRLPSSSQLCHTYSMTARDWATFQHSPFFTHKQFLSRSI